MKKQELLDQVRDLIRIRHLSRQTEKSYIYYIRNFILFHQKAHPLNMESPGPQLESTPAAARLGTALRRICWRKQLRHPDGAGTSRPQRCQDNTDLHARHKKPTVRKESAGLILSNALGTAEVPAFQTRCIRMVLIAAKAMIKDKISLLATNRSNR